LIRHPAYLAQILIWDGLAWTSRSIIAGIIIGALAVVAYIYRLSEEEQVLVNSLGAQYQAYAGKTKRLFPYLW
jgi:protein-S-isoprenylcysteine O-methyltransferase Ste14